MKKSPLIILSLLISFYGCEKEEDYSEIPFLKYKNFNFDIELINKFENQVGFLTFEFVDGNGDIGFVENSDTAFNIEIQDVFIYEYTQINGNLILTDTINYLLPYFPEGVYRKHIKGDIEIKIYFINRVNDTIKYDIQIMDREYHLSNIVSTPQLIVPEWK